MSDIEELLAKARQSLLDMSNRNRLLNCRLDSERTVRVLDELPDQVYRVLVNEGETMGFLPAPGTEGGDLDLGESDSELAQPEDGDAINDTARRHTDRRLQTDLSGARLQTRLLRMHTEARTAIEEQGINVLHLAVGFLKWYESESSDTPRYAPLILVPAKLERRSATSKFRLAWSEEDIETNESLAVKLQNEFRLTLPRLSEDAKEVTPSAYLAQVRKAVHVARWEVVDEILLGFFAFGKLRMWKDLSSDAWGGGTGPADSDIIRAILLGQQIQEQSPYGDEDFIDALPAAQDLLLVKDADSSQVLTIVDAMDGRNLVVQGPPGTGKSQTITNIIANAVASGKRVLFVAEKMAALEVVKRWLDEVGLGDSCLELHSFKASKTHVLKSIDKTIKLGRPVPLDRTADSHELVQLRKKLNDFAFAMNTPLVDGGPSPHVAIGTAERWRGTDPPLEHTPMPIAARWSSSQIAHGAAAVELLAKHLGAVGNPQTHPWRGVMTPAVLPRDQDRLQELAGELLSILRDLRAALESLGDSLGFRYSYSLAHCEPMVDLCDLLLRRPVGADARAIAGPIWRTRSAEVFQLSSDGLQFVELHGALAQQVNEGAMGTDYGPTLEVVKRMGRSAARFLSREYWRARKHFLAACRREKRPTSYEQALRMLEDLCRYSKLEASIAERDSLGAEAFGRQWNGLQSDWRLLHEVSKWVQCVIDRYKTNSFLAHCEAVSDEDLTLFRDNLKRLADKARATVTEWCHLLHYDCHEAFGENERKVPLERWEARLEEIREAAGSVYQWIEYRKARDRCRELGMETLSNLADQGTVRPDRLAPQYEYSWAEAVLDAAMRERPVLAEFNGTTHQHVIEQFRSLDRRLIDTTRQYLAARLWEQLPHLTEGTPDASPMSRLVHTLRMKRRIPPIRRLMELCGRVIQRIKPCFMMSPMSVAQFLPPGRVEFDLLVIDEASQMKPEDALGALARCSQCVIVGDPRQLPPTQFFDRLGEGDDEEDAIGDVESILDAAAQPIGGQSGGRMLRWHYRSKHESLIAFSNKEFYENRLHVFPSPDPAGGDLGLVSHHIPNGTYARSGSRKNMVEAEAVVSAVVAHARKHGELSLGVVALSKQRQEAIMDKLEEARRANRDVEWFFDEARREPFFVKNLENVQGDERDVIFISIGYGRDPQGYLHMNFGPINHESGWRRLNVLITRARRRCEVFHSIHPDEVRLTDLTEDEHYSLRGRVALRNYLKYVETGQLEQPGLPGQDVESPFEDSVARALRTRGLEVVPQVGVAGFRVDLGVLDPKNPGRYLLGIECDGATYHSARSARDRDRLRQEVLERLGWRVHRIWSLDWWRNREGELDRLLLAVEEARLDAATHRHPASGSTGPSEAAPVERTDLRKEPGRPHEIVSQPYVKYLGAEPVAGHPGDLSVDALGRLVVKIVEVESPIHEDELCRRVAELFALRRTSEPIREAAMGACRAAERLGRLVRRGSFLWIPGMERPPVRSRADLQMDVRLIAPEEIQDAAAKIRELDGGLAESALVAEVARSLGYERVGAIIREYVRSALDTRARPVSER